MNGTAGRTPTGISLAVAAALSVAACALYAGATSPLGRSGLAALLCALAAGGAAIPRTEGGGHVRFVAGCLVLLGVGACLQSLPLPVGLARVLAPLSTTSHEAGLGTAAGVPVSLAADASRRAGLLLVGAAGALVVLGTRLRARSARPFGILLVGAGIAHGVLAVAWGRYAEDDLLLGRFPISNALTACGAFPNRAQLAAFEVVLAGPALALLATRGAVGRVVGALGIGVAAVAVALSGSRIGVLALGATVAAAVVVGAPAGRRRRRAGILLVVGALAAGGAYAGSDAVRARFAPRGDEALRLDVWRGAIDLATRQPLSGVGVEAFRHAYAGEGRRPDDRIANVAENDLLQLAAEAGIPGLLLLAGIAVGTIRGLRRRLRAASAPAARAARIAGAGPLGLLGMSLVGVPLHGPAVAFAALCAGAFLVALLREDDARGTAG